uniref:C2H2-type domain-containing protein n=1 Tax=Setaria digitata TaxID=48799 RepID=A0A915PDL7_9BILA
MHQVTSVFAVGYTKFVIGFRSQDLRSRKVVYFQANYSADHLTQLVYERALEEVTEPGRKRHHLAIEGNKQVTAKQEQQKKKNVMNTRPSINFTALVGYKRLQYAGPHESRTIVSRLYSFDKLANISGGFRLYLRLMTDAVLNEICDKIDSQGDHFDKSNDMNLCVSQVLRYAWSQLSEKERFIYETVARHKIQAKYKAEQKICSYPKRYAFQKLKNDGNIGNRGTKESSTLSMQWIHSLPSMPLTEFKFMSTWAKKQKENEHHHVHCKRIRCPFCRNTILKDDTLQIHILYGHHNMYVYACHCCFEGFTSLAQLKRHCCKEFAQFILQLLVQETKLEMTFAMHTLICAECNLQVPLSSFDSSSSDKKHTKLQRLLNYHSADKLVSCVTLFAVRPSEVDYITVKGCAMKFGIPLKCKYCSHKFTSAVDIEKHQLSEHSFEVIKLKCPVCPRFYVTDCFYRQVMLLMVNRDHLLSHLGEAHSMTAILETATLWPPAFSHKTSLKMGPLLQKIIGFDAMDLSRIEKPDNLSDDEDEFYEKSLLSKKIPFNEKRKPKKIRKTDQDMCYYCKHARQLMNKPLTSSLCQCVKSKCEQKSFLSKNSLVGSLVEKFTREGWLYVNGKDSILDTTMGAVIDDSVFICVKCKGLHLGDRNTLKHLRICMQKDVDSPDPEKHFDLTDSEIVIRLSQPQCSPNGRISCPECEVTSCSIASLRRHLALTHGIFAYYNIPESHKAVGIMEYIPSRTTKDTKLDLATRINVKLNLTPAGDFKMRQDGRLQSPPLMSGRDEKLFTSNTFSTQNLQETAALVEAQSINACIDRSQSLTTKEKFTCIVCFTGTDSSQQLADHFVRSHLHVCSECGSGFIDKQCLLFHLSACQKWPRKCSDGEFFPRCPICNSLLLSPAHYFHHLLHCHETRMHISQKNQQTSKTCVDSVTENPLFSSNASVSKPSCAEFADKFVCALCEMDFSNLTEHDLHLQKHPEQWNCCPVCVYFQDDCPVRTIGELFEHLIFKHTIKSFQPKGVKIVCTLCRSLSSSESTTPLAVRRCEEQMARHILYSCNGTQICFLCNDGTLYSSEKLKKHRVNVHRPIFERFGCLECSRKFHTCSAFRQHSCSVLLKCSCGANTLFTEKEFEKHFEIHLNSKKDFCLLCNMYLFSEEQLTFHALSHRIIVNGKREISLAMMEKFQTFPVMDTVMPRNMSVNGPDEERNAFVFGKVKLNKDDDEIQFLGFGYSANDTTGSINKDQNKRLDSDVIFVAETIPENFMTNVRSETASDHGTVPSLCAHPMDAISAAKLPDKNTHPDSVSSPAVLSACEEGIARNALYKQCFTTTGNDCSIGTGKALFSAKKLDVPDVIGDEDDVSVIDEPQNASLLTAEKVLKEVGKTEEAADDPDVQVVESIEKHNGAQRNLRREAKFRCNQCTEKFLTKASLLIHKETHRYDAGQTIEAVYGIPIETSLYICRLCCLAYETQVVYQIHMRTHGVLQNCERCSVVAFNEEQMKNHRDQHVASVGRQQVVYVCSQCVATYSTDERLYHHMFSYHEQAILYFCKNCGLANTNGRVVYDHIVQSECSWKNLRTISDYVIMGFTAACIFHYQPANPAQYEKRVHNNELLVVIPSECVHRSFLSQSNDVISITCPMCNSLMSFLRLQAENPRFTGSLPRTLNHAVDDNDAMMLTMLNIWKMENVDQRINTLNNEHQQTSHLVGFPGTSYIQSQIPHVNPTYIVSNVVPLSTSLSGIYISRNRSRGPMNSIGQSTIGVKQPSSQISWVPARQALSGASASALVPSTSSLEASVRNTSMARSVNGAVTFASLNNSNSHPSTSAVASSTSQILASSVCAHAGIVPSLPSSKTPPYLQPYRGALEAVGLMVGTEMVTRDYIVKTADGQYFCAHSGCANVRIEKITSGRVHNLRHNPQNIFFCLECGSAFPFENLIVKHMVESHHQKQTPALNLRCPLCPDVPSFTRIELFKKHMAEPSAQHSSISHPFTFKQKCKLRFHSIEARLRHDHEHRATKNAPCCFVCGTSRNWWYSSARPDFPYIDHSYIHAFSLWGMCRECGLCYPNELKNQQYFNHFKEQHMIKALDSFLCKVCNLEVDSCSVHDHALERHFVIGVKTDRRKPYIVETSDTMLSAFLGFPVPDNARI